MKLVDRLTSFLLQRFPPLFGMIVTWLLLFACVLLAVWPFEPMAGDHRDYATILGWLPTAWLQNPFVFIAARGLLLLGVFLWACNWGLPWSCWLTVFAMTILWALRMENVWSGAHIYNIVNMLLIVQAIWITSCQQEMRVAKREKRFWRSELYPRWAFLLGVFYIGLYHTLAGVSKIAFSGFDWGNGLSLQLWVYLWGNKETLPYQMIVGSRTFTFIIQSAALVIETASILAIFSRWLRIPIGLGLVGFYINVIWIFGYGFHFNLLFTALFLLPAFEIVNYCFRRVVNGKG